MLDNIMVYMFIVIIAIGGYLLKALSLSGVMGTFMVGFVVFHGFGLKGLFLLGAFFLSSSLWSLFGKEKKIQAQEKNEKSERRDLLQVFANGGIPAVASVFYLIDANNVWLIIFCTSIAAANADTWASEIGTLSKSKPYHAFTLKQVDAGSSGAVSMLGTLAAFIGSILISFISFLFWGAIGTYMFVAITILGFLGNIIDTILGATIQVTYRCQRCMMVTEKKIHCNQSTEYLRGLRFMNNEFVNVSAILVASIFAFLLWEISL